ncbi:MAG: hypothetical protein PWP65_1471 [Clostridia bacterium]|nr:hypothetical protein [Clostridia bacterium]
MKRKSRPQNKADRILQPAEFPQGKIGSGYMATVAGQPAIKDTASFDLKGGKGRDASSEDKKPAGRS